MNKSVYMQLLSIMPVFFKRLT